MSRSLGEAKIAEIEGRLVGHKHACFLRGIRVLEEAEFKLL